MTPYVARFLALPPYQRAGLIQAIQIAGRRRGSLAMLALARELVALAESAPSGGAGFASRPAPLS